MRTKNIKKGSSYFSSDRNKRVIHKKDYNYYFTLIQVHMTSEEFIKHLYETYGVGRFKKYKRYGYRNDGYFWIIENPQEVEYVLRNILPFLIIKGKQAELGLTTFPKKGCERVEDWVFMKELNRRGRITPQEEKG